MLWAQSTTKDYIRAEHKLHSKSMLFISKVIIPQIMFFEPIYIPQALNRNLHLAGWPVLSYGPTPEPVLAKANTGKNRERFWKNAGELTGRLEISKEEIPGSKRSMYGYILTYCRGRTFELCVLTRWDFNFCVRSSPLRGAGVGLRKNHIESN